MILSDIFFVFVIIIRYIILPDLMTIISCITLITNYISYGMNICISSDTYPTIKISHKWLLEVMVIINIG